MPYGERKLGCFWTPAGLPWTVLTLTAWLPWVTEEQSGPGWMSLASILDHQGSLVKLVITPDSYSGIQGSSPWRPTQLRVAQWIEQRASTPTAAGSNPVAETWPIEALMTQGESND